MDKVYGDIQKVGRALKTASPAVNALLAAKLADCEENGITFIADIRTSWDGCPVPGWEMCRILGNLIDNASESMGDKENRHITVRLWEDVRSWRFAVENNGSPIPDEIRSSIFFSGFSTKGEGRGTGLFMVSRILENYGGTISVESTEDITSTEMNPRRLGIGLFLNSLQVILGQRIALINPFLRVKTLSKNISKLHFFVLL
jgi:sensor histidine kinase regulating citrate/malate metabolism